MFFTRMELYGFGDTGVGYRGTAQLAVRSFDTGHGLAVSFPQQSCGPPVSGGGFRGEVSRAMRTVSTHKDARHVSAFC
jgi:hypothetical protein